MIESKDTSANSACAPFVSVILIIPEKCIYIEESLASFQSQTLKEIEIILVAYSKNVEAKNLADRIASSHYHVKSIYCSNDIGDCFARNEGLKHAKGQYVIFMDSGDLFANPNALKNAVRLANDYDADLIRLKSMSDELFSSSDSLNEEGVFSGSPVLANPDRDPSILKGCRLGNFLFRLEYLKHFSIEFVLPFWGEMPFVLSALNKSNWIAILNDESIVFRRQYELPMQDGLEAKDLVLFSDSIRLSGEIFHYSPLCQSIIGVWYLDRLINGAGSEDFKNMLASNCSNSEIIAAAFDSYDIDSDCYALIPEDQMPSDMYSGRIFLLYAALRLRLWRWVDVALRNKVVQQSELFEEFFKKSNTKEHSNFLSALNHYARNEMVTAVGVKRIEVFRPKVIVHIGSTKTGSTYIQHFLEKNRAELLRNGVWYPEVGLFWQKERPHKQAGHALFTEEALATPGEGKLHDYIESGLRLAQGKIHTVILSSEAFFTNRNSVALARHFQGCQIEMIGYFRRQDDWVNSQYAESVAGGAIGRVKKPIRKWLSHEKTRDRLDYYAYLESWSKNIGRENVSVRIYDRNSLEDGDVLVDFMTSIGLRQLAGLPRPSMRQSNDFPFSTAHVLAIRRFNTLRWKDSSNYLKFIDEVTRRFDRYFYRREQKPLKVNFLSVMQRKKIMRDVEEKNAMVAKLYLERDDGVLFAEVNPKKEKHSLSLSEEEVNILIDSYIKNMPNNHRRKLFSLYLLLKLGPLVVRCNKSLFTLVCRLKG